MMEAVKGAVATNVNAAMVLRDTDSWVLRYDSGRII